EAHAGHGQGQYRSAPCERPDLAAVDATADQDGQGREEHGPALGGRAEDCRDEKAAVEVGEVQLRAGVAHETLRGVGRYTSRLGCCDRPRGLGRRQTATAVLSWSMNVLALASERSSGRSTPYSSRKSPSRSACWARAIA